MTREEAIESLELLKIFDAPYLAEAVKIAAAALRAQQEPVKLDRSRWEGCKYCLGEYPEGIVTFEVPDEVELSEEDVKFGWNEEPRYCPICGKPLTEGAWARLAGRMGGNDG